MLGLEPSEGEILTSSGGERWEGEATLGCKEGMCSGREGSVGGQEEVYSCFPSLL